MGRLVKTKFKNDNRLAVIGNCNLRTLSSSERTPSDCNHLKWLCHHFLCFDFSLISTALSRVPFSS